MKCPKCGEEKRIRQNDKFCHKCGCNLKKIEELESESVIPKLVIVSYGSTTHIVLDGMHIGAGIEEFKYSARDDLGNLEPTIEMMKISVSKFKRDDGKEFLEKVFKTK